MASTDVSVFSSIKEMEAELAKYIRNLSLSVLSKREIFTVALSGGSAAEILGRALRTDMSIDWKKWRIFLSDERFVPLDAECVSIIFGLLDKDSNYKLLHESLFHHVGLHMDETFPLDTSLPIAEAAEFYEQKVMSYLGPSCSGFDLVVLGMGPDGHTCSLFPDHPLLHETQRLVSWMDNSPKPPPSRVTLTLKVLNQSSCVLFLVTGAGKAATLKEILENPTCQLPSSLVKPAHGCVRWFLDLDAASHLDKSRLE